MKKIIILLLCFFLTSASPAMAADRYWVGNGGDWSDDDTHWATSSGGSPADGNKPTASDNCIFDGDSFPSASQTVTVNEAAYCLDLDWTEAEQSPTFAITGGHLYVSGSLTFIADMTVSSGTTYMVEMNGSGTHTITAAGHRINYLSFNGTGTFTAQDTLETSSGSGRKIYLKKGTFDANDQNIICNQFSGNYTYTKVLYMGSGTWTIYNSYQASDGWIMSATNTTLYPETSTISLGKHASSSSYGFSGAGLTYNNLVIEGGNTDRATPIKGSNTFNALMIEENNLVHFTDGTTQTVTSLVATGDASNPITLTGSSTGGWTISDSAGTNSVSYANISYSTATGGATWDADDGTNTDGGNNSGWIFPSSPPAGNVGKFMETDWGNIGTIAEVSVGNIKKLNEVAAQ
jgi:hypothetical protein